MTYTPKEWETGDIIGARDLNHIEFGIEANASATPMNLRYTVEDNTTILDNTWQEIHDALGVRMLYWIMTDTDGSMTQTTPQISVYIEDNQYIVAFDNSTIFTTDSADGYPSFTTT